MAWEEERRVRKSIVDIHRRLYELGFSVANDGNTSVRISKDRILITPMGLNKATLKPEQIVMIDSKGSALSGGAFAPSSERALHTAIYNVRSDIQAIIHAHPPYAIACSLIGLSLEEPVLPEVLSSLGKIPTARYATPSTEEFGIVAAELVAKHDAVILVRHGSVTVGKTLDEALQKLERVEHTAKILSIAKSMGNYANLAKPDVEKLIELTRGENPYRDSSVHLEQGAPATDERLIEMITKEVRAVLSGTN